MNQAQTFEQFIAAESVHVSVFGFTVNLVLAAFLAYLLGLLYTRYGQSLSNRKIFARNFVLMTMTTMVVISIVKSSLALSLGLVGALSIVRFRAAIKEPEELSYLFVAIAVGLGLGANQRLITVIGFLLIAFIIFLSHRPGKFDENKNLYLTIASHAPKNVTLEQVVEVLSKHCAGVRMKRFDETKDLLEASFLVEFSHFSQLKESKEKLQELDDSLRITYLDNQ